MVRAECEPPISVLEWGKTIQVTGLLHTEPPHRILQLYWTLFSAFFAFRFSTMAKITMTDVCIGAASVAHLCIQRSIRNDHVILVNFITPILPGAWSVNRNKCTVHSGPINSCIFVQLLPLIIDPHLPIRTSLYRFWILFYSSVLAEWTMDADRMEI
jgi:hypothetical protein